MAPLDRHLQIAAEIAAATDRYTADFYNSIREGSRRSAKVIVPLALELTHAEAVIDVGCGDGTWLAEFRERGVNDTTGLDGEYVDRQSLKIPRGQFRATDLSMAFELPREFDLAISLEVGEHLPPRSADSFVDSLTKLAPIVLFSAAIPFQGGTRHLNEQWPDYWATLFRLRGYVLIDCIRPKIWDNDQVEWWYRQNCFIYAKETMIEKHADLCRALDTTNLHQLALVHPRHYVNIAKPRQPGVRAASGILVRALTNAVRKRVSI